MNFLSAFLNKSKTNSSGIQLQLESLEPRMMLSTVEIIAAGTLGGEQLQLQIDGAAAVSYTHLTLPTTPYV